MNRYQDLKIWKKSMLLAEDVYRLSKDLPKEEKYGLISQIKRSSVSIPSNIAEGAGRNSNKEFLYFLSVAQGSLMELETQLQLLARLELIGEKEILTLLEICTEVRKMNYALQKSLK